MNTQPIRRQSRCLQEKCKEHLQSVREAIGETTSISNSHPRATQMPIKCHSPNPQRNYANQKSATINSTPPTTHDNSNVSVEILVVEQLEEPQYVFTHTKGTSQYYWEEVTLVNS